MKKILFTLTLIFMITGCTHKSYVKFVDNSIQKYISISSIDERVLENGLKEIQISGKNDTNNYMLFKYRVIWEDAEGFSVKSLSSRWTEFSAYKNTGFKINVIAPNEQAVHYQLYINK